jgi:hypothetical protein
MDAVPHLISWMPPEIALHLFVGNGESYKKDRAAANP